MNNKLDAGIYLKLDDEIYFSDTAVGSTDVKSLIKSPSIYWKESNFNPESKLFRKQSPHLDRGSAFHCLLFEPNKFFERYFVSPGCQYDKEKKMIRRSDFEDMKLSIQELVRHDDIKNLLDKNHGYPEVSVVWIDEETGVRCKGKHDFFASKWSVDYKTIKEVSEKNIKFALSDYGYITQCAHYLSGRKAIRAALKEGKASFFGEFSKAFKEAFLESDVDYFPFIFQETKPPYIPSPIVLPDHAIDRGYNQCQAALRTFKYNMEVHGPDKPWPPKPTKIRTFDPIYGYELD